MSNKIPLNKNTNIDRKKLLQSRMVILANSGGGKSYAIRKFVEGAVADTQVILIDPEGEFASLREKYDFILAGKNADVPVETRSAALLATRLLELGKSAIIDLYELHPQDRQRYVKLFFDAMVNAPKELYHDVFIVLDEAHEYAPEGKPSEATWAVEALASKGRKRGFCLIPASQRISKLSKNVSAECNNKLIGRASQDIDMKRAGDELGFNKEKLVQLRQLKPGEFFAFGPAISDEVVQIKIGEVTTSHDKVSYKGKNKVPPPSHIIKQVLSELVGLPEEAEQEVKTIQSLKSENLILKRENQTLKQKPAEVIAPVETIQKAVRKALSEKMADDLKFEKSVITESQAVFKFLEDLVERTERFLKSPRIEVGRRKVIDDYIPKKTEPIRISVPTKEVKEWVGSKGDGLAIGKGEMIILNAVAQYPEGVTNEHIAVLTGYKSTSRSEYLRKLKASGLVHQVGDSYLATPAGVEALGPSFEPLPTGDALREHIMRKLPEGERKIMSVIIEAYPAAVSPAEIEGATGYKSTSRSEYVRKLKARKLVETHEGMIRASDKLYD